MDSNSISEHSLPIYYDRDGLDLLPFKPFVVAPIRSFQDTLIVAPNYLANLHDKFINNLYTQMEGLVVCNFAVKIFRFGKEYCIATLIPIKLMDESGRGGQCMTIGYLVRPEIIWAYPHMLGEAFRSFFKLSNKLFGADLPDAGGDEVVRSIRASVEGHETSARMETLVDTLLLASNVIADLRPDQTLMQRLRRILSRERKNLSFPKILLFPHDVNGMQIIEAVIREVSNSIPSTDVAAAQEFEAKKGSDFLALRILSWSLAEINSASIRSIRGHKYLRLY